VIIPPSTSEKNASVIMINRKDGCCTYFDGEKNIGVTTSAATLDPIYDFLWTYEWRSHMMRCYNVVASAVRNPQIESNMWLAKPPYAIPVLPTANLQRWQAGANLLACMDSLIAANVQGLGVHHEEQTVVTVLSKMYSRDDYNAVCRFESHGGGWGYSGHSIEAIRFSCDSDALLGGLGLFGGRGEYCAKIKVGQAIHTRLEID
jgi:E3 ubiquitin-protein ligase MYCBP2